MKKLILIFFIVLLALGCNGQPLADYKVEWSKTGETDTYKLFVWEGVDTTNCPFNYGNDYLNPDVTQYFKANVSDTVKTITLNNDGLFVIVAVVAVNQEDVYSGLGVSKAYIKRRTPNIPALIRVIMP